MSNWRQETDRSTWAYRLHIRPERRLRTPGRLVPRWTCRIGCSADGFGHGNVGLRYFRPIEGSMNSFVAMSDGLSASGIGLPALA